MASHADTIRRYIDWEEYVSETDREAARAGLDALLAENQQLRDALRKCANYIQADLEGSDYDDPTLIEARDALAGDGE